MNADANQHSRGEVVDVNVGDEDGGTVSEEIVTAGLSNKPEWNGPVPLSDLDCRGLVIALERMSACRFPGLHNDAQDALDGRIEACLNCAGSPNLE